MSSSQLLGSRKASENVSADVSDAGILGLKNGRRRNYAVDLFRSGFTRRVPSYGPVSLTANFVSPSLSGGPGIPKLTGHPALEHPKHATSANSAIHVTTDWKSS